MNDKLIVLIINDMVIFPNNEVRIEYDNTYDKAMIDIVDKIDDSMMRVQSKKIAAELMELTFGVKHY